MWCLFEMSLGGKYCGNLATMGNAITVTQTQLNEGVSKTAQNKLLDDYMLSTVCDGITLKIHYFLTIT